MNDENKIDLSIEMYEDLKETLVKAIKNAKAGGAGSVGLENAQLERATVKERKAQKLLDDVKKLRGERCIIPN